MNDIRVSIVLPVYNGSLYLPHQLDSIIPMLGNNDEVVISYDKSIDNTLDIVKEYAKKDTRIKVFINEGKRGVWSNSINALKHVRGKFIFACDQDDEWFNNKIDVALTEFDNSEVLAVVHDGYVCDANLNIIPPTICKRCNTNDGLINNYIHNSITGCCLAYRKELVDVLLETPFIPDAADQWVGMCAIILGRLIINNSILIKHRIHEANYTPKNKRKLTTIIHDRLSLLCNIIWLYINKRRYQKRIKYM